MKNIVLTALAATTFALSSLAASADNKASVTLINAFVVPLGKEAEAIEFWEKAAEFMKRQPGYISTQLHQSIAPDAKFGLINVAKWESAEAFKEASSALRRKGGLKPVEGMIPNPSLYTVIRTD